MKKIDVAMVCKLMPYYRVGIFQELTSIEKKYRFSFFGDIIEQGGIKQIPYSYSDASTGKNIRWIKTRNYFYRPEALLWQTGIIKEIFQSKYKIFVFEGGTRHLPIWLYSILCKLKGKKILFWTHGNRGLDTIFRKFIRRIFFDWLSDGLLLYGHFQRNLMIEEGYSPDKLFVIYNSLQPKKQFRTLARLDKEKVILKKNKIFESPERTTLIFIGRLVAHKGVMKILEVINILKNQGILANCIFIGKGPERIMMDVFCKDNKLEKQVFFAGELYEEHSIAQFFTMADLMVSPNNVGLNCIHSLAYGVPILTHGDFRYQNPEVEAILDGETGWFFKHNDIKSMLDKLKLFIKSDVDKRDSLKKCQESIMKLYNPKNQARCMMDAFDKIR